MRHLIHDAAERDRALAYLHGVFENGGPLSHELLKANRFTDFEVELLICDGVDLPNETNYARGLTAPTAEERARGWQRVFAPTNPLRDEIFADLAEQPGRAWVFEDPLAKKGDPVLQTSIDQRVFVEDRVYAFVQQGSTVEQVVAAVSAPQWWQYVGIQARLAVGSSLVSDANVSLEFLQSLAASAVGVLTMVFDGEGYMLLREP